MEVAIFGQPCFPTMLCVRGVALPVTTNQHVHVYRGVDCKLSTFVTRSYIIEPIKSWRGFGLKAKLIMYTLPSTAIRHYVLATLNIIINEH